MNQSINQSHLVQKLEVAAAVADGLQLLTRPLRHRHDLDLSTSAQGTYRPPALLAPAVAKSGSLCSASIEESVGESRLHGWDAREEHLVVW